MSEDTIMSSELSSTSQPAEVTQDIPKKTPETVDTKVIYKSRGGFMGGGFITTFLFLVAFFLVSYYLGYVTSQYNKLSVGLVPGAVAGQQTANTQQAQQAAQKGLQDGAQVTEKIEIDDKRVKGNKDAKVTVS